MSKVEIKKRQIFIGTKKVPLISGEIHYWRLNPSMWSTCLDQVREMGLDVIATYVPWFYHEYKRGAFDFIGRTDKTRDLKKFLALCKKKKFLVIIRPGPYIYSECPNDGVPDYAYKYHRLHPKFLAYAETYIREVCAIIKPFLATRPGGHIIMLQADNEIDPWPDIFGHQYGFGAKSGLFQKFISDKYDGEIARLNEAWGAQYSSFDETGPYIVHHLKGDKGLRRHLDYFQFKHYYCAEVARWVVKAYRDCGITVPIYLNLYPFHHVHDWRRMESLCDMTGIDLYPENEFFCDANDHRKFMDKIRYLRTFARVPYIAEFSSGVWHNHHYASGVLSPNHYRLITFSALAAGICGWNWYMLVNRDNWYMAPINEWGRPRYELTSVFKDLVTIFKAMKPYECQKLTDVAVSFDSLQYAAKTVPQNGHVISSLYDADIDYEIFDPSTGAVAKKVLFYSGNQWLCKTAHETLFDYVRTGGTLVLFRNYPRQDDQFKPCDLLGLQDPSKVLFEFKKECSIRLPDGYVVKTVSSIYSFNSVPGKKITASISGCGEYLIGYEKKIQKGRIIHIGIEPNPNVLFAILKYVRVNIPVYSRTPDIHTALFKRGRRYYLVIINNGEEDKSAMVFINHSEFIGRAFCWSEIPQRKKICQDASKRPFLSFTLARKNGTVLELRLV
jgi:hypothetical protein